MKKEKLIELAANEYEEIDFNVKQALKGYRPEARFLDVSLQDLSELAKFYGLITKSCLEEARDYAESLDTYVLEIIPELIWNGVELQ